MLNQVDEDDELLGASEEGGVSSSFKGSSGGMCACLSVEYYRPFFDVDTEEVLARLKHALFFCGAGPSPFMELISEKPDA